MDLCLLASTDRHNVQGAGARAVVVSVHGIAACKRFEKFSWQGVTVK